MLDMQTRHDLLTALNQIIGYSEMLAEEAGSDGQEKLCDDLGVIKCAAHGMAQRLEGMGEHAPVQNASAMIDRSVTRRQNPAEWVNARSEVQGERNGGRILVIDDDPNNRELLSRQLQKQGYRTATADNGAGALARLAEETFDLVLLDVIMPEMDGFSVLSRLKADKTLRQIPVIMISACTDMGHVIKCIELGAEDYLPKPFNSTLLQARIGASLEKKRLREQEMNLISQALQAEAALDRHRTLTQAVAGVAHEINTPLGIVRTALSVIRNRLERPKVQSLFKADPETEEFLQDILECSVLMNKHVNAAHRLVENFKKIAVDQVVEHQETVNVPALVEDAIDLFKISARQAKLDIALDVSGIRHGAEWRGYPGYLRQILLNFLQNIERYAYPNNQGGKVEITVGDGFDPQHNAAIFILTVRDFGAGISREHIARIFEPFYTTGRGRGGSGLGLAIVSNMVTIAMCGKVTVDSEPGEGTCFTVTFPKN